MRQARESETAKAHDDERRSKSRVGGGRRRRHDESEESLGEDKARLNAKSSNQRRDQERDVTDAGK